MGAPAIDPDNTQNTQNTDASTSTKIVADRVIDFTFCVGATSQRVDHQEFQ
jgi:hypothetical protein